MLFNLMSTRPVNSSVCLRDHVFGTISRTYSPNCFSWTPLFAPYYFMVHRLESHVCYSVTRPWLRGLILFSFDILKGVSRKFLAPSILCSLCPSLPLGIVFMLVLVLHCLSSFAKSKVGRDCYLHLTYISLKCISLAILLI